MEGTPELLNNNNFREYFRGIFFEVTGTDTNLLKFDMTAAKIDIYFTSQFDTPSIGTVDGDQQMLQPEKRKKSPCFLTR